MRNRFKLIGMAAVAALALTALAVQEGVVLKRAPKAGEVLKYRLKAEMDFQGTPITFSALVTEKVNKVEENGNYAVQSGVSEAKIDMGGNVMDAPTEDAGTTTTYNPQGLVLDIKGASVDESAVRLSNLQSMQFPTTPLKVGDTWTIKYPKSDKGAVEASGTYKVEAAEKIGEFDTYKITGKYKESVGDTPASAEGTYWVSVKDGSLVKLEGSMKNAPFPQVGAIDAKVTMTRDGLK